MNPIWDYFVFAGKSSLDFAVKISRPNTWGSPDRDVETVEVPGRNGVMVFDNGRFKNIDLDYDCYMLEKFDENMAAFRDFMGVHSTSYYRLEDSYHGGEFRLVRFKNGLSVDVVNRNDGGSFTVTFDAKPQRYLIEGEKPIEIEAGGSVTLVNPTCQTAKPKIVITAGTGELGVGDETLTINANAGGLVIDSELQDIYLGTENKNGDVELSSGEFPTLPAGNTAIQLADGMTAVIYPRWWRL